MRFVKWLKEVEHEHGRLKQMRAGLLFEHASLNGGRCHPLGDTGRPSGSAGAPRGWAAPGESVIAFSAH